MLVPATINSLGEAELARIAREELGEDEGVGDLLASSLSAESRFGSYNLSAEFRRDLGSACSPAFIFL